MCGYVCVRSQREGERSELVVVVVVGGGVIEGSGGAM